MVGSITDLVSEISEHLTDFYLDNLPAFGISRSTTDLGMADSPSGLKRKTNGFDVVAAFLESKNVTFSI